MNLRNQYLFIILIVSCIYFNFLSADTPVNCSYEEIKGVWIFHEGQRGNDKSINCSNADFPYKNAYIVHLEFPDKAIDENGYVGFWTMISNQGFEVFIHNRKYFAYLYYEENNENVTSYCHRTFPGWAHVTGVNPGDWSCYVGFKYKHRHSKSFKKENFGVLENYYKTKKYSPNYEFINEINSNQSSWTAKHHNFLNGKSIHNLIKMTGGQNSLQKHNVKLIPVSEEIKKLAETLPSSFDWRNVNGTNYVSPVRDQGELCGSCYSFASTAMIEARIRIQSFNAQQPILSPQDVIECSRYTQGCHGGWTYLVSGKYGEDFGFVEESCNPYIGVALECSSSKSCKRYYSTNYHMIGGFYGACSEPLMRVELVKNGPIALGFEYYDDFLTYSGGVYHHTYLKDKKNFQFEPFELTNHAVLLVGYGTTNDGEDYWIAKNSWGTEWGESGFFRIRRGTDECGFESIAVGADPVL